MDTLTTDSRTGAGLAAPPAFPLAGRQPLHVTYEVPEQSSRFWAIPVVGLVVKSLILIPHFLMLWVLGIVVELLQLVAWVPVLFAGRYPEWAYDLTSGYVRWSTNVTAYAFGLTDQYPPFQLGESNASANRYAVCVELERQTSYSRFWAVPVIGLLTKVLILIPHFLILGVLALVVGVLQLVLWVPVLFLGRFPAWGRDLVGGYVTWYARVLAFQLGVTDQYPAFQLG